MYRSRKYRQWWVGVHYSFFSFLAINAFHRGSYGSPSRRVQLLLEGRSVSVFLRKPIVIFQGGGVQTPLPTHAIRPVVARTCILCACAYLISALAGLLWDTYSILIGKLDPFHAEYLFVLHTSPFLSCSYMYTVVGMHFQSELEKMWILIAWF